MIYPWHEAAWQRIHQSIQSNRLPHALLLSGLPGLGKMVLAQHLIRALLCVNGSVQASPHACCQPCRLFQANTHPDVLALVPEGKSHAIKIEHIRAVIDFVPQSASIGNYRFVLIPAADSMNTNAANALLKTLEEPTPGTIIILLASQIGRLPATVISRCQHIHLTIPSKDSALSWLKEKLPQIENHEVLLALGSGAPLQAVAWSTQERLQLRDQVFKHLLNKAGVFLTEISEWLDEEVKLVLSLFAGVGLDVARIQAGVLQHHITNQDYFDQLQAAANTVTNNRCLTFLERVHWYQQQLALNINLNKQLMYENLLIYWHGRW